MVTGGSSTQYEEITDVQLTLDELAAGVEEAKKRHRLTLAHANNSEGAMLCVQAGVNSIDHGNILNKEALDAMKKAGSFYVPTMYCYVATATNGPKVGVPEWEVEKSRQILDVHRESFQRAYRMGINIATGTDLGPEARGGPVAVLGEGLIAEMELMAEYGMTPADTIKAATCVSARNLGIDQSTGTLQEGKLADLVIIDGDPLDDIGNLRRVWRVMKEGRIVYEA
jgi:imidazolonepropionase-like amidohydrolase